MSAACAGDLVISLVGDNPISSMVVPFFVRNGDGVHRVITAEGSSFLQAAGT